MSDTDHDMTNAHNVATAAAAVAASAHLPQPLSPPSVSATKERHSLTLDQRRALRRWANSQQTRPSHRSCIEWFTHEYGQIISQSTVSHSLSPKYSRLDGDNPQLSGSRLRFGNWPDVEKLVLVWYQQVLSSGRHPTNEELADKAKTIFAQLPRYKDEQPPEFSPGWIHRFKKRYGLLLRRQRRHGDVENPAEDVDYLADCVPRFLTVSADMSPAVVCDTIRRVLGMESSLNTGALVRDEIIRRQAAPQPLSGAAVIVAGQAAAAAAAMVANGTAPTPHNPPEEETQIYADDDPEVVLQNALRQLQQEEAAAEASAAAVREERERTDLRPPSVSTPNHRHSSSRFMPPDDDLTLTPIDSGAPMSSRDRPVRCPFCVNQRMLRTIKEAVEHMSTHVVV